MTTENAGLRTYWPSWAGWATGACAVLGPILLAGVLHINLALGMSLAGAPLFVAQMLFAPYPDEWDTEVGGLTQRTRERWIRAWRRALVGLAVVAPLLAALYFGIMSLDLS